MRIRVGHWIGEITGATRVFMGGRELHRVIEADDSAGWAIVAAVDDAGQIMVDRKKQEVVYRRLYGSIRFRFNMERLPKLLHPHVARVIQ